MNFVRRFLSIRLDWLLIGLIVGFAVCLNSCSAVSTLKGYSSLCLPFALLACLLLLMFTDVEKNNTALTGGLLVFVLPVVFSALANFDSSNVVNSLTLLSCIFLAYLCVRKFGSILMCRIFVKLMCISAAMSLILYLATNLLRLNLPFPVLENVNGIHYKTIFIVSQYAETYIDGSKSMGFLWESGIFASYLLLAIAIEFMVEEKASIRRLALLVIALFTTGSTAGYLILPIALTIGLLKSGGRGRVAISVGIVIVVLWIFANYSAIQDVLVQINPTLFWKLGDADAVTKLTRLQSPSVCWDLFSANPIFGLGYGDALEAYSTVAASSATIDSLTTTSFFQLAAFGISGFAMWGITIYALTRTGRLPLSSGIMLVLLFVIIINKEPHTASVMTYILLFSFLSFTGKTSEKALNLHYGGTYA